MSSVDILADLGSSAEARAVARVLSAAAAPPWPHELRGYESARRAFENAGGAASASHSGTTPVRHSAGLPLRRLLGVKLAAVAGALTVTGVAVAAAEADVLPSPIQRAAHHMFGGVGVPEPDPQSGDGQSAASGTGSSSSKQGASNLATSGQNSGGQSGGGVQPGTPVGTSGPSGQSTSASTDPVTLCRTYVAHTGSGEGSGNGNSNGGLSDHDHRVLVALAGGVDKIDAYCAQVLAAAPTGSVPQPSGTSALPTTPPSVSPDPSHDHKPDGSSSSDPVFSPQTDPSSTATDHTHTPSATRSGH